MLSDDKVVIFFDRLQYLAKKYGSFSPKNFGKIFLTKSVFGYFKTKKERKKKETQNIKKKNFVAFGKI